MEIENVLEHLRDGVTTYIPLPNSSKQVFYKSSNSIFLYISKNLHPVRIIQLDAEKSRKLVAIFLTKKFYEYQLAVRDICLDDYALLHGEQN